MNMCHGLSASLLTAVVYDPREGQKMYYLFYRLGVNCVIHQKDFAEKSWLSFRMSVTNHVKRILFYVSPQVAVSYDDLYCLCLLWRFIWLVQSIQPYCALLRLLAQGLLPKLW